MKKDAILSKLISFDTDNNLKGITNCINFVSSKLKKNGWKTTIIKNKEDNKPNLIAVFNGKLANEDDGFLLAGHIDTVSTDKCKWKGNPRKLLKENNDYYGLGISDMKNFSSAILNNLKQIVKMKLSKPLFFVLTSDEETNMFGVKTVCDYFRINKVKPSYALIGEPTGLTISTSNKGFYEFKTVVKGIPCHSSNPDLGRNAIYICSKFISFLEKINNKYEEKNTTLNVGIINGGRMCNIVADECVVRWEVRTSLNSIYDKIKDEAETFLQKLKVEYDGSSYENILSFEIPPFEKKQVLLTSNIIRDFNLEEKPYVASTECGYYQKLGIDCVIYGCGKIEEAHSINEKISINNYLEYQKSLLLFIKEICQ